MDIRQLLTTCHDLTSQPFSEFDAVASIVHLSDENLAALMRYIGPSRARMYKLLKICYHEHAQRVAGNRPILVTDIVTRSPTP